MIWKCHVCGHEYPDGECPTCHMRGEGGPVGFEYNGIAFEIQRPPIGPIAIVRKDGKPLVRGLWYMVLQAFLASLHGLHHA
jgi:hypothetical protein